MAKIKVHELAKELEVQSKDIIGFLQGLRPFMAIPKSDNILFCFKLFKLPL